MLKKIFASLRMAPWAIIAGGLLAVLLVVLGHWQELPILIWKWAVIFGTGFLAYWLDRSVAPYARPHLFRPGGAQADPSAFMTASLRRAIVIGSAMIAAALAL